MFVSNLKSRQHFSELRGLCFKHLSYFWSKKVHPLKVLIQFLLLYFSLMNDLKNQSNYFWSKKIHPLMYFMQERPGYSSEIKKIKDFISFHFRIQKVKNPVVRKPFTSEQCASAYKPYPKIISRCKGYYVLSSAKRLWLQNVFDIKYFIFSNRARTPIFICYIGIVRKKWNIV